MKNFTWFIAIVFAYIAGYFSHGGAEKAYAPQSPSNTAITLAAPPGSAANNTPGQQSTTQFAPADKPEATQANANQLANTQVPATAVTPQPAQISASNTAAPADSASVAKKYPKEISDEEIDKVIPAPFNQQLKNTHGDLREKYKDFAEADQPQSWDLNMQHKLMDAILSNPYAKFITLESLMCKQNLCEIRLYEKKDGAWSLIQAEMSMQDWWDIGQASSNGFEISTDKNAPYGYYVLLARK